MGVRHTMASTKNELTHALRNPKEFGVIEVRADRAGLRDLHAAIREAVAQTIT
jgi:2-succinyl-5-enolpyruvyl-6-hydroxy-3-cyclohexene-1-carboxylate synthase